MTKEEIIEECKQRLETDCEMYSLCQHEKDFYNAIIKALEQPTSDDCVSLVKVFEIMGNLMSIPYDFDRQITEKDVSESMDEIKALPPVTPTQRWIPVSERLPKEHFCDDGYVEPSDYVLVWGNYGNYGISRYWGNRRSKSENPNSYKDWVDLDWVVQKAIAWQPLPQPYEEKRGN